VRTLVMKFGGTTVGNTTALTQVVSIVLQENERWDRLIIVVSALEGVTDALIEAARLAQLSNRRGYRRIAATIRIRHLALVEKLPLGTSERNALQADIDQMLFDMLEVCQTMADATSEDLIPTKTDTIIGVGERLSARIVAALLRQNNLRGVAVDAIELIITDTTYGHAKPDMQLTQARINEHLEPMLGRIIPVVTGFIAGTPNGTPTTLGRGGSDYTASILGVCVNATETWMWTTVDGLMSTDPQLIENARVIPELSYDEVAELAYFGAKILHSRMIGPLKKKQIPLRVKNVFKPQLPGTLIHLGTTIPQGELRAVTAIQGISLSASYSGTLAEISSLVNAILHKTIGSDADVMISAQSSSRTFLTFVIPTASGPDAVHNSLIALNSSLAEDPNHTGWQVDQVSVITVIGTDIDTAPGTLARIFAAANDVRLFALSQGPSRCSISLVVQPEDTDYLLKQVHDVIINSG